MTARREVDGSLTSADSIVFTDCHGLTATPPLAMDMYLPSLPEWRVPQDLASSSNGEPAVPQPGLGSQGSLLKPYGRRE